MPRSTYVYIDVGPEPRGQRDATADIFVAAMCNKLSQGNTNCVDEFLADTFREVPDGCKLCGQTR